MRKKSSQEEEFADTVNSDDFELITEYIVSSPRQRVLIRGDLIDMPDDTSGLDLVSFLMELEKNGQIYKVEKEVVCTTGYGNNVERRTVTVGDERYCDDRLIHTFSNSIPYSNSRHAKPWHPLGVGDKVFAFYLNEEKDVLAAICKRED